MAAEENSSADLRASPIDWSARRWLLDEGKAHSVAVEEVLEDPRPVAVDGKEAADVVLVLAVDEVTPRCLPLSTVSVWKTM